MRKLAVAVAAAAALAVPAAAFAHAQVVRTFPAYGARLQHPPDEVRIAFTEEIDGAALGLRVFAADGTVVSLRPERTPSGRGIAARLPALGRGGYTVRWHVLARDGHVTSGVYTFGVRVAAPPPTQAYGAADGPTRSEDLVRWAYFLALALLVGGLGFRLLVLRGPLPQAVERRFYAVSGAGVVAALQIGVLAFVLRAEDALQLPFGRLLYADLSPIASTAFGSAFIAMTLGYALAAALLFLAWLTERRALLWPSFLVALGFASGLSLSGHSAADAGASWKSELADWVHLSAACLWVGGIVQLGLVVWPLAPELRRRAFLGFSRIATVLIALILAAGVYLSVLRLPHLRDLWTTGYGQVLLVKLSLVAVALGWGGFHHFVVAPALDRGSGGSRLRRSLVGESMVGMAVLLLAAVLVNSKPPPLAAEVR